MRAWNRNTMRFMVRSLTKKGVPSKAALTDLDWRYNAFADEESANRRVAALEDMNPGSRFVVTAL